MIYDDMLGIFIIVVTMVTSFLSRSECVSHSYGQGAPPVELIMVLPQYLETNDLLDSLRLITYLIALMLGYAIP